MSAETIPPSNPPGIGETNLFLLTPKERLLTEAFTNDCWEHGIDIDALSDDDRPAVSAIAHDLLLHAIGQHNQRQLQKDPAAPTVVTVNASRVERHLAEYYETEALASTETDTVKQERHAQFLATHIQHANVWAQRFTEIGVAMHLESSLQRLGKVRAAECVQALLAAYGKSSEHLHIYFPTPPSSAE